MNPPVVWKLSWGVCPGLTGDGSACGRLTVLYESPTGCCCVNTDHNHEPERLCAQCDDDLQSFWHGQWSDYYSMTTGYHYGEFRPAPRPFAVEAHA